MNRTAPGKTTHHRWLPGIPLLYLIIGPFWFAGALPAKADEPNRSDRSVPEVIERLRSGTPDTDPFEISIRVQSNESDPLSDRISEAVVTNVRPDQLHLTWLDVGYLQKQDKLTLWNRDWVLTPDSVGVHHWWIEGNDAAFARAERTSAHRFLQTRSLRSLSTAFQQLLVTYFAFRWTPSLFAGNGQTLKQTHPTPDRYVLRTRNQSSHRLRKLEVQIASDGRISSIRLIERRPELYFFTNRRQFTLKLEGQTSFHDTLPGKATLYRDGNRVRSATFSYTPIPDDAIESRPPAWYRSLPPPAETTENDKPCAAGTLISDRHRPAFRRASFRKRIRIHRVQARQIRSCADREKESASHLLREMAGGLRFTRDPSHVPARLSGNRSSVFLTLLRLLRSVEKDKLEELTSTSTSVPSLYAMLIHLMAFRNRMSSVEQPERIFNMLNRITRQYDLSRSRLFVREVERRIRGAGDTSGLVQDKGKEFLIALRKTMKQTPVNRLLMARVFRFLGYFERADKHYAALFQSRVFHPELHAFMDIARTRATVCLRLFDRPQLGVRELLYRAAVEAEREKVDAARKTMEHTLERLKANPRLTLLREDYRPARKVFDLLLSSGHRSLVQRMMIQIIRREAGLVLSESYFFPLVNRAFGENPEKMYRLVRHLTVPVNVSPFMAREAALNVARERIENGSAGRLDLEWVARALSTRLERDREVPAWIRTALQDAVESHPESLPILEHTGDLMLATGHPRNAHTLYRNALRQIRDTLEKKTSSTERLQPVGPYVSIPDRRSSETPLEPRPAQPLVVKYSLTARTIENQKTGDHLNELVPVLGAKSSWRSLSSDPGVKANYELQFLGWGLSLLDRKKQARRVLKTGFKRERGRFPYGNMDRSASFGFLRMLNKTGRNKQASDHLRRMARWERADSRPFRYATSAGRRYVKQMRKQDNIKQAVSYLRSAAAREWRQVSDFTYRESASETLFKILKKNTERGSALEVLKKAFFRSMADLSGFKKGTAPRALVRELESRGRPAEALMVCRRLSAQYGTDPEPLKKKISTLQNRLSTDQLIKTVAKDGAPSDVDETTRKKIDRLLASLKKESTDRFSVVRTLEQMNLNTAPYLNKKRNQTSDTVSDTLRSVLQRMAWRKLRRSYSYPNFLK